jgi:hypothetical protein
VAEHTPICDFGWKAPSFTLPGVDGKTYSLEELKGPNGTLIMFVCNHCPYVKAVIDRIVRDADALQDVARAYDAVCTPDFFGFNGALELQYRGRLDASGREPASPGVRRELFEAMKQIAETGQGPREQTPSIGCSIKWKAA